MLSPALLWDTFERQSVTRRRLDADQDRTVSLSIDIRAALETNDGARIMSIYTGVMEMGEDGYRIF